VVRASNDNRECDLRERESEVALPFFLAAGFVAAHFNLGSFRRSAMTYGLAIFSSSAFKRTLLPPLTFSFRSQSLNPAFFTATVCSPSVT